MPFSWLIALSFHHTTQALSVPMTIGDKNVSQSKASGDENVLQHQRARLEVAKKFIHTIILAKAP